MIHQRTWSHKMSGIMYDFRLIGRHLMKLPPWAPLSAILGPPSSWRVNGNVYSEFNLVGWGDEDRTDDQYTAPWIRVLENLVQTSTALFTPRIFPFRNAPSSYPFRAVWNSLPEGQQRFFDTERWFFINGIATNPVLLDMNGAYLHKLFGRPIELINNPTDGVVIDMLESIFGRTFDLSSTPQLYARRRIEDALTTHHVERVVVLAHSQGAIVASNVVRKLIEGFRSRTRACDLRKLEVYTFGSAADEIDADDDLSREDNRLVPYMEHFANTNDVIARLGILEKEDPKSRKIMDGQIYTLNKSGHLLNAHYLCDVAKMHYSDREVQTNSRLYGYLNGKVPDYYNPILGKDLGPQ